MRCSFSQGEGGGHEMVYHLARAGGEVSNEDERENTVEPVEQTIMCPGHEHLLSNVAVFNATRDLASFPCMIM